MFEQALDLDPGFALAYSWLARVNVFMVNMSYGDREEHMAIARGAIARALELAPDLPEAHLALGYYYRWLPDLDQALREVAIAEEGRPGDPEVFWAKATTLWQLERWDEAVDLQFRVVALDPRNPASLRVLGTWLKDLRRYDEAEQNLGLSLRLQPDRVEAQYYLASIPWAREGDPEPLRQWSTKQDLPTVPWSGAIRWQAAVFARDYEAALNVLQSMDVEFERWTPHFPRPLLEGLTHRFLGNPELAQAAFEAARLVLEDGVRHQPGDPTVRRALALAYAGLGMREEAVREARVVADLLPGFRVPSGFEDWGFVWVYSLLGDDARAVEHLDSLLASPVGPSVNEVRADPFFDDLHSNRRFQALLERYADALEH
jgi:tetratricopeptide (TPR) repeat protein